MKTKSKTLLWAVTVFGFSIVLLLGPGSPAHADDQCHESCQELCHASCEPVCTTDCRIDPFNGKQVCQESCKTICTPVCNVVCHRVCN
jgi:hypothetical protein